MQRVGMERYAAFRGDPVRVGKVRLIDNEGIALPTAYGVPAIGRRHSVPVLPSVGGDDLKSVIGLRQHDYELRCVDDLSDTTHVKEAQTQSAERCGDTTQCRVVLVSHRFGLGRGPRLIQTGKRGWRWCRTFCGALRRS